MHNQSGHQHIHIRKRVSKGLEPYPHPNALKRLLDHFMLLVAIGGPLAMLPQLLQTFATRDVLGLSLLTWSLWTFFSLAWLIYGLVHKDMPIIISQGIYVVFNSAIVIAILVF